MSGAERQRTVVDGRIQRLSVSQVAQADPAAGGCLRRWWFLRVARREEPPSRFQELGTALHSRVERYLKTGEDVLCSASRPARALLPPPRHPLVLSEAAFGGNPPAAKPALSSRDVLFIGRIDLLDFRELGSPVVDDVKTSSDVARWAKSGDEVARTPQMIGYAEVTRRLYVDPFLVDDLLEEGPDRAYRTVRLRSALSAPLKSIRVGHLYVQTRGPALAERRAAELSPAEVEDRWEAVGATVERMKAAAAATRQEDVEPNLDACGSWGGCPHAVVCARPAAAVLLKALGRAPGRPRASPQVRDVERAADVTRLMAAAGVAPPPPVLWFKGEHEFLSNFYPAETWCDGVVYPTSEHAYQAAKTADLAERARVLAAVGPADAKRVGRTLTLRPDWEDVKVSVMEAVLRSKFRDPDLRARLLATGEAELVEGNCWSNVFWGVCDGVGENQLGRLLMRLRAECVACDGAGAEASGDSRLREVALADVDAASVAAAASAGGTETAYRTERAERGREDARWRADDMSLVEKMQAVKAAQAAQGPDRAAVEAEKVKLLAEEATARVVGELVVADDLEMDVAYVVDGVAATFCGSSKGKCFFDGGGGGRLVVEFADVPVRVRSIAPASTLSAKDLDMGVEYRLEVADRTHFARFAGESRGFCHFVDSGDGLKFQVHAGAVVARPVASSSSPQKFDVVAASEGRLAGSPTSDVGGVQSVAPPDAPAPSQVASPAEVRPEPLPGGRCGAAKRPLTDDEARLKRAACALCGLVVKVKPQRLGDGRHHALLPEHPTAPPAQAPLAQAPPALVPTREGVRVEAADPGGRAPAVYSPREGGGQLLIPGVADAPRVSDEVVAGPQDQLEAARRDASEARRRVDALEAAAVGATDIDLYVDCLPDGVAARRLEAYVRELCAQLEATFQVADVRCAPKDSPLAFGGWRGALAAAARDRPPEAGAWAASSSSDLQQVVVEALSPGARVVRGLR